MKRYFLLLTTTLLTGTAALAQYENEPTYPNTPTVGDTRFRFGAYIAPNVNWMKPTADNSDDGQYRITSQGNRAGYVWGLLVDYYFAQNYGIATGFNVNSTGGKLLATLNPGTTPPAGTANVVQQADFNYKLQYLEVPFALKLRTDEISNFKFFGQIGLTLAFNIGKKADYEVSYTDSTGNNPITSTATNEKIQGFNTVMPFGLQLNVGAGLEYPIANKLAFYTGIFFNNGFAPDATNPKNYELGYKGFFSDGNIRMNSLALRIGLLF